MRLAFTGDVSVLKLTLKSIVFFNKTGDLTPLGDKILGDYICENSCDFMVSFYYRLCFVSVPI